MSKIIPDAWTFTKVIQTIGLGLLTSAVFLSGATYQKITHIDDKLGQHVGIKYHGLVGERITTLESQVQLLRAMVLQKKQDEYR